MPDLGKYKARFPGEKRKKVKGRSPETGAGDKLPSLTKEQEATVDRSKLTRGELPMKIERMMTREKDKIGRASRTLAGGAQLPRQFDGILSYMGKNKGALPSPGAAEVIEAYRDAHGTKTEAWQRYRDIQAHAKRKGRSDTTYRAE